MKLFGFEIIVRRLPKPQPAPEPVTDEQARAGFQMMRDAIPVGDDELARAKRARKQYAEDSVREFYRKHPELL
jgi:hypothetical protein